jgi:hypothetical protein
MCLYELHNLSGVGADVRRSVCRHARAIGEKSNVIGEAEPNAIGEPEPMLTPPTSWTFYLIYAHPYSMR